MLQGGLPAPASFAPPAKSLMNLATTIDSLAFSPDQQVARHSAPLSGHDSRPPCDLMLVHVPLLLGSPCARFTNLLGASRCHDRLAMGSRGSELGWSSRAECAHIVYRSWRWAAA